MKETTLKFLKWALGALLILVTVGLVIFYFISMKNKKVGGLAVDAIEAAHAPAIRDLNEKISKMRSDLGRNLDAIADAEEAVEKHKDDLRLVHNIVGLSAEEQAERYAKLKI